MDNRERFAWALLGIAIFVWLITANDFAKYRKENPHVTTSTVPDNSPAPSPASCTPVVRTVTIYRDHPAKAEPAISGVLPEGSRQGVDEARLRELAKQADSVTDSCRGR